jgi:hypothetical protein
MPASAPHAHQTAAGAHLAGHILITKADGEQEVFSAAKLEHSLALAGASSTMRARITAHMMRELRPGITT